MILNLTLFFALVSSISYGASAPSEFCKRALIQNLNLDLSHPVEERGRIQVPLDYSKTEGPQLNIVYRLIYTDKKLPLLVIINGGPGYPSSGYRSYEYENGVPVKDRISPLLKSFKVLLMDQRGTEGLSSRLDMSQVGRDYSLVASHFGSQNVARDTDRVLQKIVPSGEKFYLVGQSYGGRVAAQYVTLPDIKSKPAGVIFASAAMPHYGEGGSGFFRDRREMQKDLNYRLQQKIPNIKLKLVALKFHLQKVGLNPNMYHKMFSLLGQGEEGVWESNFLKTVESLTKQSKEDIEKFLNGLGGLPDPLNYILSSSEFTPGTTDRLLFRSHIRETPFEPWMVDEEQALIDCIGAEDWFLRLMDRVDQNPPAPAPFPSVYELNASMSRIPTLLTFADQDGMIPPSLMYQARALYPSAADIVTLSGGHQAIMTENGRSALERWILKSHE